MSLTVAWFCMCVVVVVSILLSILGNEFAAMKASLKAISEHLADQRSNIESMETSLHDISTILTKIRIILEKRFRDEI
jgi:hypothetical protein